EAAPRVTIAATGCPTQSGPVDRAGAPPHLSPDEVGVLDDRGGVRGGFPSLVSGRGHGVDARTRLSSKQASRRPPTGPARRLKGSSSVCFVRVPHGLAVRARGVFFVQVVQGRASGGAQPRQPRARRTESTRTVWR